MLKPVPLRLLPLRRIVLMLACLTTTTIAVSQALDAVHARAAGAKWCAEEAWLESGRC